MEIGDEVRSNAPYKYSFKRSIRGIVKEFIRKENSNTTFVVVSCIEVSGRKVELDVNNEVTLLKNDLTVIKQKK